MAILVSNQGNAVPGWDYANIILPYGNSAQKVAPYQQQQPVQQPYQTQSIQPYLNRLTQQANNALYGGLLGYNQNLPMMSGGQNPQTFAAPQGNFRDAFAGMQGLLGGNR